VIRFKTYFSLPFRIPWSEDKYGELEDRKGYSHTEKTVFSRPFASGAEEAVRDRIGSLPL